jgi:hypothetical protein
LTFFNSALGKFYPGLPEAQAVSGLIVEKIPYLRAISAGAVFMGANTYIGNAPNFMVKSIAEEAGVKCRAFSATCLNIRFLFWWCCSSSSPSFSSEQISLEDRGESG